MSGNGSYCLAIWTSFCSALSYLIHSGLKSSRIGKKVRRFVAYRLGKGGARLRQFLSRSGNFLLPSLDSDCALCPSPWITPTGDLPLRREYKNWNPPGAPYGKLEPSDATAAAEGSQSLAGPGPAYLRCTGPSCPVPFATLLPNIALSKIFWDWVHPNGSGAPGHWGPS